MAQREMCKEIQKHKPLSLLILNSQYAIRDSQWLFHSKRSADLCRLRKDFVNVFPAFNSVEDDFTLCLYLTANPIVAQPYSVIIFIASYFPYIKLACYVLQLGDVLKNQPFYFPAIGAGYVGEIF